MSRARECGTKQRHATRAEAKAHRAALVRSGSPVSGLSIYRCPHCGAFHVGHRKRRRR